MTFAAVGFKLCNMFTFAKRLAPVSFLATFIVSVGLTVPAQALECNIFQNSDALYDDVGDLSMRDNLGVSAYFSNPFAVQESGALLKVWGSIGAREVLQTSEDEIIFGSGEAAVIAVLLFSGVDTDLSPALVSLLNNTEAAHRATRSCSRLTLYRSVKRALTEDLRDGSGSILDRIALRSESGDRLLVSLTDLSSGEPMLVDVTAMMKSGKVDSSACLATLLVGAGSRSSVRPPVTIDGRKWADGDLKRTPLATFIDLIWQQEENGSVANRSIRASVLPIAGDTVRHKLSFSQRAEISLRQDVMRSSLSELRRAADGTRGNDASGYLDGAADLVPPERTLSP